MGSTCSSASEEVVEKPKQEDNVEKEAEVKQEDTVLNKVEKELPQPEPVAPRPQTPRVSSAIRPLPSSQPRKIETTEENEYSAYSITRLLLLGAAESGKTTLLEQVRLLYKQNFTEAELYHAKAFIYNSVLLSIKKLIHYAKTDSEQFSSYVNSAYAQILLLGEQRNGRFTREEEVAIHSLWRDPVIQKAYNMRSAFSLSESTAYFMEQLERINKLDYVPNPQDVIMSYVPTVGVQNVIFTANKRTFQLFDIGGKKIDRRKWATMYDGIDAIFFLVALAEYNQYLEEQPTMNRLQDSLCLLKKISIEPKFQSTPIFLFLNECDVFEQQLRYFPLENYLPDYEGSSAGDALDYLEDIAREHASSHEDSLLHVYRSVAIDTTKMSKILSEIFKKHLT